MARWRVSWDRRDAVVLVAAVTLVAVAGEPWFVRRLDGAGEPWSAWASVPWSRAVGLAVAGAALRLAYRRTGRARGAAWLALLMLTGALGTTAWEWQRNRNADVVVSVIRYSNIGTSPAQDVPVYAYQAEGQWGLYAATLAMAALLGGTALDLRRRDQSTGR